MSRHAAFFAGLVLAACACTPVKDRVAVGRACVSPSPGVLPAGAPIALVAGNETWLVVDAAADCISSSARATPPRLERDGAHAFRVVDGFVLHAPGGAATPDCGGGHAALPLGRLGAGRYTVHAPGFALTFDVPMALPNELRCATSSSSPPPLPPAPRATPTTPDDAFDGPHCDAANGYTCPPQWDCCLAGPIDAAHPRSAPCDLPRDPARGGHGGNVCK